MTLRESLPIHRQPLAFLKVYLCDQSLLTKVPEAFFHLHLPRIRKNSFCSQQILVIARKKFEIVSVKPGTPKISCEFVASRNLQRKSRVLEILTESFSGSQMQLCYYSSVVSRWYQFRNHGRMIISILVRSLVWP